MFTASVDEILPTTVTGSWPKPRWFDGRLDGRPLSSRMKDVTFREQFTDSLSTLISDQERSGLDILTHGDYFHDEDLGGHSWHRYPLERWDGLAGDYPLTRIEELLPLPGPGGILREVYGGWRWPRAVGKVAPNEAAPLEYAKIWRIAQARSRKPVRFGTVSAQGVHQFLDVRGGPYDDNHRELIWDMAGAMNTELRQLAAAGCKVIQVEEPLLHFVALTRPNDRDWIDFLVSAFNREVEGLDDVEVWVHTCWGNPNMQRSFAETTYEPSIEIYLDRIKADVWTLEIKDGGRDQLKLFEPFAKSMKKKLAIGVVSHRTLQVETPSEVAELTREAIKYIGAENLILSSDCGFGRQGCNRLIAFSKATAIALGANIVRRELGLSERYVPAADPALQIDG
jgi:5-methyltetrahydropteroyltriglutamate--homocysteine methyltransferase